MAQQGKNVTFIAATAGRLDHRMMADNLDNGLIRAIMETYEPKALRSAGFPEFPHRAFSDKNANEVQRVTRNLINLLKPYDAARGFETWFKPSGRSAFQPSAVTGGNPYAGGWSGEPMIDYGEIGSLCDGQNIQIQGSIPDRDTCAINNILKWYDDRNVNGSVDRKPLFLQCTVRSTSNQGNSVTPSQGLTFFRKVWAKIPDVAGGTLWWAGADPNPIHTFLKARLREL